jgi:hypothetical protein
MGRDQHRRSGGAGHERHLGETGRCRRGVGEGGGAGCHPRVGQGECAGIGQGVSLARGIVLELDMAEALASRATGAGWGSGVKGDTATT